MTDSIPLLDLHAQYTSIKPEIDRALASVLAESVFVGGQRVRELEAAFARWVGTRHCVACANGTDALELLFGAHGIGPGDEVIVPANTWISCAEAVTTLGATPIFVDPDPLTYNLTPRGVERALTPRTAAILAVHLYGQPADVDVLLALARPRGIRVFEDCAQAHGARQRGRRTGTLADGAIFSFFPGKNLGAYGDGGALVTNDDAVARHCRLYADHGRTSKHEHELPGRNSRLDTLQAAVLLAKLPHVDAWNDARRAVAARYDQLLAPLPLLRPSAPEWAEPVWHQYVVQLDRRDEVRAALAAEGIQTGVHYPVPIPFTPAYRSLGWSEDRLPEAVRLAPRILSLPIFPELDSARQERIAGALARALEKPAHAD